jgi:type I restriction enzyme S subunit
MVANFQRATQINVERHALTPALRRIAFRGELVPQNPNDEPVSVLLRRIEDEKRRNQRMTAARCP